MQNVAAEFTIGQRPSINAEFSIEESQAIDTIFTINVNPTRVSQLENDSDYQTGEQVAQSIQEAITPIEEDLSKKVETIEGSRLIDVSRNGNNITLTSQSFVFEQGIASNTWVINHGLGKKPTVVVVDSSDSVIVPENVIYDGLNTATVIFLSAFSGKAYLN